MQSLNLKHNEHYRIGKANDLRDLFDTSPFVPSGCMLLLCTRGRAIITTNARKRTFLKGDLLLLFSDTLFTPISVSHSFSTEYIVFSLEAMEEIFYKMTSIVFWNGVYNYPVCRLSGEQYSLVQGLFRQMMWTTENCDETCKMKILQNCIHNLFMALDAKFKSAAYLQDKDKNKDRAWMLFGKFMSLLTRHCYENKNVGYYADRLCITTDYLYKVTNKIEQRSPKEIINTFVVTELKRYLDNTELSIKDLAVLFHFEDPSYMCRFFRRMTGLSVSEYRNRT